MSDEQKTAFEHTLDLCVFAPLGFALEARSLLPKFIDRGRNQIVLARVVGKYAVRKGTVAAEGALGQATEQAMGVLRLAGLGDTEHNSQSNGHKGAPASTSSSTDDRGSVTATATTTTAEERGSRSDDTAETTEPAATEATRPSTRQPPPFDPETLAIPDYDSLSASQVVPRLESLTADELESVREYESATRARKTILNKIVQLQST